MLRVVVVNHSHPSMPHVSGMRAWRFAGELAARGHQVVHVCEWREGATTARGPEALTEKLRRHDWHRPFVLAVKPTPTPLLNRVRSAETGSLTRKWLVVRSYLTNSGMFTDFSGAAEPWLAALARDFTPHVCWGIFGNTDCWLIAQKLARLSAGVWVADMKDAWDSWIPAGLRSIVAKRFSDMAASTANAEFHAASMARWFPTKPAVIYSGVDDEWIQASAPSHEGFRVVLVGGIYRQQDFRRLIGGLAHWVQRLPEADRRLMTLCYAGSDADRVRPEVATLQQMIQVDIKGYVPLTELAVLCRGASVNVYIWSPATFHHKVVELLCSRRPIIAFPGESLESVGLAKQAGGSLHPCHDEIELQRTLDRLWKGGLQPTGGPDQLRHLTWRAQADVLEHVLERAAPEAIA